MNYDIDKIGGYFSLECPNKNSRKAEGVSEFLRVATLKGKPYDGSDKEAAEGDTRLNISDSFNHFDGLIPLNCARNCLKYIVRAFKIEEIYIPFYTCPVIWQTLKKEHCKIKFYHIDENFYPVIKFPQNAYILYNNYFGINSKNVEKFVSEHKNAIIDNAQAFYMPSMGIASFNSVRKFFGVPDGAFLYTTKHINDNFKIDSSYRLSHLLQRLIYGYDSGYNDFLKNEQSLDTDIMYMSEFTKKLILSIDIQKPKEQRIKNFNLLHQKLKERNRLRINISDKDVPMYYPFYNEDSTIEKRLENNNIYVEKLWNSLPTNTVEGKFQEHIMLLPIDQRYDEYDMQRILNVIFLV